MADQPRITCQHCGRRMARHRFRKTGTGHYARICIACTQQSQRDPEQVQIINSFNLWFHPAGTGQLRPTP